MSTIMDYIINLLFTLLQIVANDKIISHIVIMSELEFNVPPTTRSYGDGTSV